MAALAVTAKSKSHSVAAGSTAVAADTPTEAGHLMLAMQVKLLVQTAGKRNSQVRGNTGSCSSSSGTLTATSRVLMTMPVRAVHHLVLQKKKRKGSSSSSSGND
jgi:hypothetical protein